MKLKSGSSIMKMNRRNLGKIALMSWCLYKSGRREKLGEWLVHDKVIFQHWIFLHCNEPLFNPDWDYWRKERSWSIRREWRRRHDAKRQVGKPLDDDDCFQKCWGNDKLLCEISARIDIILSKVAKLCFVTWLVFKLSISVMSQLRKADQVFFTIF